MSDFAEDDARLAGMHGYRPVLEAPPAPAICPTCESANLRKTADGWWCERCYERDLEEWLAW